jgi:hypothetical protein
VIHVRDLSTRNCLPDSPRNFILRTTPCPLSCKSRKGRGDIIVFSDIYLFIHFIFHFGLSNNAVSNPDCIGSNV